MILMWSCPGNMVNYYPGLRDILPTFVRVICLSDLGNILAYYLDKTILLYNYYMTSDNVFSDWLTSAVTFFHKTLFSTHKRYREVNIIFQTFSRHLKIEIVFPNYLKSSSQSSLG